MGRTKLPAGAAGSLWPQPPGSHKCRLPYAFLVRDGLPAHQSSRYSAGTPSSVKPKALNSCPASAAGERTVESPPPRVAVTQVTGYTIARVATGRGSDLLT